MPWRFLTATFPPGIKNQFEEELVLTNPIPTYIRFRTNRVNVRYSVIQVKMQTEIQAAIESALRTNKGNEKVLIFCPSVREVRALRKSLDCCMYYLKYDEKEKSLKDWKEGLHRTMVASSALGAGMDVDAIGTVIHIGKTYGCSCFVQESGRGGREGQPYDSITILERSILERLEGTDMRLLTPEDRALTEFLTTKHCRCKLLSRFQDGEEHESGYVSLNAALCDNCKNSTQLTATQKWALDAESELAQKRQRHELYDRRSKEVAQHIQEDAMLVEYIQSLVGHLKGRCSVCWAMDHDEESRSHTEEECHLVETLGWGQESIPFAINCHGHMVRVRCRLLCVDAGFCV